MRIFIWSVIIIWLLGWIRQIAYTERAMKIIKVVLPKKEMYVMIVVMFFTWPYFYFYSKF